MNVNEMRLYQTPNALTQPQVTVTADTTPARQGGPNNRYSATNLLKQFGSRGHASNYHPYIDVGIQSEDFSSCY